MRVCCISVLIGCGATAAWTASRGLHANTTCAEDPSQSTTPIPIDPVTSVDLIYPLDGAIERPPVIFKTRINLRPGAVEQFTDQYSEMSLCIETQNLNKPRNATRSCIRIKDPDMTIQHTELGNFTACFYIAANNEDDKRYWSSRTVTFSVVPEEQFDTYVAHQVQTLGGTYPGFDTGIVEWAAKQRFYEDFELLERLSKHLNASTITSKQLPENEEELLLVIGIKTAVAANFVIRQAIRQTWARKQVLPVGVKVFFLGCRPRANTGSDDDDWNDDSTSLNRLMEAVELEKMLYGDLLTDELDCEDSYEGLAKKVKQFLHFVAINYARAKYVMIADDDLYVRMDKVVHKLKTMAPPVRFYSGQVRAIENAQKETPIRVKNPKLRYALSKDQFPMSVLLPFALGAYVFLSMDCVLFISKNRKRLHDLSGMDDMSIALWLLSIQVHPQPFRQLEHLRGGPCNNDLITIGDLSPLSIRLVHDNLLAQRAMCHGFNHHIWLKPASLAPSRTHCSELPYTPEALRFEFFIRKSRVDHSFEPFSIISTRSKPGMKVFYLPFIKRQQHYFRRVCSLIRLTFTYLTRNLSCADIAEIVRSELQTFCQRAKTARNANFSHEEVCVPSF